MSLVCMFLYYLFLFFVATKNKIIIFEQITLNKSV